MTDSERSEKLYEFLEEISEKNLFSSIKSPVDWQRELREANT